MDSADQLLFFPGVSSGPSFDALEAAQGGYMFVGAVSERTLSVVGGISVSASDPSNADVLSHPVVEGLTYLPGPHELLVLSDDAQDTSLIAPTPFGDMQVNLSAYTVSVSSSGALTLARAWSAPVPGCISTLSGNPASVAFSSQDPGVAADGSAVFFPCISTDGSTEVVVKVPLPPVCAPAVGLCSASPLDVTETEIPGTVSGFMFDPGSERAFLPTQASSGTSVLVYDGSLSPPAFVGRVAIVSLPAGVANPDFNVMSVALDSQSGRFYGFGPTGLSVIDGNLTPLEPGSDYGQFAGRSFNNSGVVIPPDAAFDYPRVILPVFTFSAKAAVYVLDYFDVFADRSPVGGDVPATSVDANTYDGPINPADAVSEVYGANVSATGAHTVWAGSYGGVINNLAANGCAGGCVVQGRSGDSLPFGGGNRDLLAGWVQNATLQDGSPNATSSALADGNGTTATGLGTCTASAEFTNCTGESPPGSPPPTPGQVWPVGQAACPVPTKKGVQSSASSSGAYVTTGYDSSGNPQTTLVPGSDSLVQADVNCAATGPVAGSVSADAHLQGLSSAQGSTGLSVGSAGSTGVVSPPAAHAGAVADASAFARSVTLSLPDGSGLSIGEITQTAVVTAAGRPGTAWATRTVTLGGVVVSSGGARTVICPSACVGGLQQVIDEINAALPTYVHVSLPQAYSPFGTPQQVGDAQVIPGSPGGYEAVVQPDPGQQARDTEFYGMLASNGESSQLPALRIVVYQDGSEPTQTGNQLDRVVVDLAPVEADAEDGVTVSCPPGTYAPDPSMPLDCQVFSVGGSTGFTGGGAPGSPGAPSRYVPGSAGYYLPGTAGSAGGAFVPATLTAAPGQLVPRAFASVLPTLFTAPGAWLKKVFAGFRLLARSPVAAAEFFGFLCLLAAPAVLAVRRRRWQRAVSGG